MIGNSKKRIAELENRVETLETANTKLTNQNFQFRETNDVLNNEIKQLRDEQQRVVTSDQAEAIEEKRRELDVRFKQLSQEHQELKTSSAETIEQLKHEISHQSKARINATAVVHRLRNKLSKLETS